MSILRLAYRCCWLSSLLSLGHHLRLHYKKLKNMKKCSYPLILNLFLTLLLNLLLIPLLTLLLILILMLILR